MPLPTYLMSNFPSVRPSLNLQFDSQPTPEDMTSHLASVGATFSRASIGTYTDANGLIQEASAGQARPNYSSAGVHEGLLLEGASTNLVTYSEDFSTTWTTTRTTVTTNQVNGLDGTLTADLLKEDNNLGVHHLNYAGTFSSGTTYTFSTFAKNASGTRYLQLRPSGIGSGVAFASFDLVNGEIPSGGTGGTDFDSAKIEDVGNGWYRCSMTATYTGTPTGFMIPLSNSATTELASYTGDNTSGFYIWGAQVEEGSQPTSYIPTSGSTATRSADVCYIDGTAFTDFYNDDESTLLANYILKGDLTNEDIFNINDGTTSNEIFLRYSSGNTLGFVIDETSGQQALFSSTSYDSLETAYKAIITYKTNSVKLFVSGTQIGTTDTSAIMPTVSEIGIGYRSWGGDYIFNGTIKKLIYFPRQLSDNELIKLTQ